MRRSNKKHIVRYNGDIIVCRDVRIELYKFLSKGKEYEVLGTVISLEGYKCYRVRLDGMTLFYPIEVFKDYKNELSVKYNLK